MLRDMGWLSCIYFVLLVYVGTSEADDVRGLLYLQPEQIHISYGDEPTSMVITWTTFDDTNSSIVEYGPHDLDYTAVGDATLFVDGGSEHRTQYIHRVTLTGLKPNHKYWYHCGSNYGWSALYYFQTMRNGSNWSPRLALFGDMGNVNAQSLSRLQKEVQQGLYDAVLHVGDFAYDMDTDNARVGDEFMRQIEPVAAIVPYMTCVGNHEARYNFSNYKHRFSMPGTENNLMYSFNVGPVHFIAISTEFYYFLKFGFKQVVKQYLWLEKDLKEATKPENRALRPWIVTFGHRPMYCSNLDHDDCKYNETLVRVGVPLLHWFGLEKLFYDYGVDLEFWAHEHSYERLWPIYDRQVYNGSYDAPYTNPKAPVHITTGSAGCQEEHDIFHGDAPKWSAFRSVDYGYTRMTAYNASHVYLEQVSDDKGGEVIDKIWIIKDRHGPYDN